MSSGTLAKKIIDRCDCFYLSLLDVAIALSDGLHCRRIAQDLDCVNKRFEVLPFHHVSPDFFDFLVDFLDGDTRAHNDTCAVLLIIIRDMEIVGLVPGLRSRGCCGAVGTVGSRGGLQGRCGGEGVAMVMVAKG